MSDHEQPEEVGASTERFEAFVKRGEELEGDKRRGNAFWVVTLLAGLVVLVAVVALLLR